MEINIPRIHLNILNVWTTQPFITNNKNNGYMSFTFRTGNIINRLNTAAFMYLFSSNDFVKKNLKISKG